MTVKVYDFFYSEVAILVDAAQQNAGRHRVVFDPNQLERLIDSGMYFYELRTNSEVQQRRMLYIQ